MSPKYFGKHSAGSWKSPGIFCTSQGPRPIPRPKHGAAEESGCCMQGKASNSSVLTTLSRFSQLLPKPKSFTFEIQPMQLFSPLQGRNQLSEFMERNYCEIIEVTFSHFPSQTQLKYFTTFSRN